jgi:hypothetical protein
VGSPRGERPASVTAPTLRDASHAARTRIETIAKLA